MVMWRLKYQAVIGRVQYSSEEKKSDQENLVRNRQVARSQRCVVVNVFYFRRIISRNDLRKNDCWQSNGYKRNGRNAYLWRCRVKIFTFVNNGFVIAAGAGEVAMTRRHFHFLLTGLSLREQSHILNFTTAEVHAYHETGGWHQHQKGKDYRCYGAEIFHLRCQM